MLSSEWTGRCNSGACLEARVAEDGRVHTVLSNLDSPAVLAHTRQEWADLVNAVKTDADTPTLTQDSDGWWKLVGQTPDGARAVLWLTPAEREHFAAGCRVGMFDVEVPARG
jgi:hypothetical protein